MPLVSTQNNSFSTLHIWPLKHSKEKKKTKSQYALPQDILISTQNVLQLIATWKN